MLATEILPICWKMQRSECEGKKNIYFLKNMAHSALENQNLPGGNLKCDFLKIPYIIQDIRQVWEPLA